jgi:hypothetical protein
MEKPIGQLFAKDAAPAVGNQFANLTDEQISAAIQEKASVRSAAVAGKVIRAENTGTRSARVEMATEFVRDVLLENNPMRNQIVAATQDDVQRHVSDLTPPMSGTLKRVTAWTVDFITLPFKPARLLYGW